MLTSIERLNVKLGKWESEFGRLMAMFRKMALFLARRILNNHLSLNPVSDMIRMDRTGIVVTLLLKQKLKPFSSQQVPVILIGWIEMEMGSLEIGRASWRDRV